jgi:hypothetical protein
MTSGFSIIVNIYCNYKESGVKRNLEIT